MSVLACKQLVRRLSDYIDGTIDDSFCEHLDSHLADCKPCRAFIRNLRRTVKVINRQGQAKPSKSLRNRLQRQLRDCKTSLRK